MKRVVFIGFLIIALIIPAFAGSKTAAPKAAAEKELEEYAPKVVVNAAWGNGAGECGYLQVYAAGPGAVDVAPNGKIYVLDEVNGRVNVYAANGQFEKAVSLEEEYRVPEGKSATDFCVDTRGNMYISSDYDEYFLDRFDGSGRLVKRYVINKPDHGKYFARDGRTITLNFRNFEVNTLALYQDADKTVYMIAGEEKDGGFLRGKYSIISDTTTPRSWKVLGRPGRIGGKITERYRIDVGTQTGHLTLSVADKQAGYSEKLELLLPEWEMAGLDLAAPGPAFDLLGRDAKGNVYIERRGTVHAKHPTGNIYKFAPQGGLASKIEMGSYYPVIIDAEVQAGGDVYSLAWNSNYLEAGVRVARWSRVPPAKKSKKQK